MSEVTATLWIMNNRLVNRPNGCIIIVSEIWNNVVQKSCTNLADVLSFLWLR